MAETLPLPLAGIRVLDLTRNIAGPYASMILGELGADVVKVEHARGDDTREWGPPFVRDEAAMFLAFNRNKRDITLDLKAPEAREVLDRAVRQADVLIDSFRPGDLDRLGFGYDWASTANPAIVYCSVGAYGSEGPLRDLPGYDPIMQAHSGIMSVTGHGSGAPVRCGVAVVDMGTGMWAATAILSALISRQQTGQGQHVKVSLFETALGWMTYHLAGYWGTGRSPAAQGSAAGMLAPYEAFATSDGYVMICAGNDRLFSSLCQALGHSEWTGDERFVRNSNRVAVRAELHQMIEAITSQRSSSEIVDQLRSAGIPCGPINDTADAAGDAQSQAIGIFQPLPRPDVPGYQSVALPVTFDGQRPPLRLPPPAKGQHNRDVLEDLGFANDDLERLLASPAMRSEIGSRAAEKP